MLEGGTKGSEFAATFDIRLGEKKRERKKPTVRVAVSNAITRVTPL